MTTKAATSFQDGDVFTVNGKTITIKAAALPVVGALSSGQSLAGNVVTDGTGNSTLYLGDPAATNSVATVLDLTTAIDLASGRQYVASVSRRYRYCDPGWYCQHHRCRHHDSQQLDRC